MKRSTDRASPKDPLARLCRDWAQMGLFSPADRARAAKASRKYSSDALIYAFSDGYARRILEFGPAPGKSKPEQRVHLEPSRYSVFEEFLAPEELRSLLDYALSNSNRFQGSQVLAETNKGVMIAEHRRSRVLFDVGHFHKLVEDRLRTSFKRILRSLNHRKFAIASVEAQLTASNDGEFFGRRSDNTFGAVINREITYVLFCHREPKAFSGGELRLYNSILRGDRYVAGNACVSIVPRQNMLVFFPSHLVHEITKVSCPSRDFADSRFTLNGWIHRRAE